MLTLPPEVRAQLGEWVRAGYPHETCGVLVGTVPAPGDAAAVRVEQARNLNTSRAHDRYELDPQDYLKADTRARADGLEIVGIWHSHPDHPARPSETDRAAAWEGYSYVIVAVTADDVADLRSWRLVGEAFEEEEIRS